MGIYSGISSGRNCTRCGKELTDAASMEAGIGPVCRHLDNALLAKQIPANLVLARELVEALDITSAAPESLNTLTTVCDEILGDTVTDDHRKCVKRIEWLLSFGANDFLRKTFTSIVAALGYVGLASLWNGEAATGLATCAFADGRLFVTGPKNKAARKAFGKISNSSYHANGSASLVADGKACWSFPAAKHAEFFAAISAHYPNNTGLAEAIELAQAYKAPAPVVVVPVVVAPAPVIPAPTCSVVLVGSWLKVTTPKYSGAFYAQVMALPSQDRLWSGAEKCWKIAAPHAAQVKTMLASCYGATL